MTRYITIHPTIIYNDQESSEGEYHLSIDYLLKKIEKESNVLDREEMGLLKTLKQVRLKNGRIKANKYQMEKLEDVAYQVLNYFNELEIDPNGFEFDSESGEMIPWYWEH